MSGSNYRLALVLIAAFFCSNAPAHEPHLVKGMVVSAGNGRLVLKDTGGREQSYTIDPVVKIMVNGKLGRLEDLKESMSIQVSTDEKGQVLAVSTIDKDKRLILVSFHTHD